MSDLIENLHFQQFFWRIPEPRIKLKHALQDLENLFIGLSIFEIKSDFLLLNLVLQIIYVQLGMIRCKAQVFRGLLPHHLNYHFHLVIFTNHTFLEAILIFEW